MMKKLIAASATFGILAFLAFSWFTHAEETAAAQPAAEPSPAKIIVLEEGKNYRVVRPAQPTQSDGKIEVMEIFWYGCPHCHDFEPYLNKWLATMPDDVAFRRLPGIFRESWVPAARAYYAAEALAISEKMHPALFRAIHEEQRVLGDTESWAKFFGELGVSESDFLNTWDSVEVAGKVRATMAQSQSYGIEGVPAVVVAGRYQTSAGMEGIGDFDSMLKVVNALIDKARQEVNTAQQ